MWDVILWTFGSALAAWIVYNAREMLRAEELGVTVGRRRRGEGPRMPSYGERRVAEWLKRRGVAFEFDKPIAGSLREPPLRPDFVLRDRGTLLDFYPHPDDPFLPVQRDRRAQIYARRGWKSVSVTSADLPRLDQVLTSLLEGAGSAATGGS
jgi:hypothetical protein